MFIRLKSSPPTYKSMWHIENMLHLPLSLEGVHSRSQQEWDLKHWIVSSLWLQGNCPKFLSSHVSIPDIPYCPAIHTCLLTPVLGFHDRTEAFQTNPRYVGVHIVKYQHRSPKTHALDFLISTNSSGTWHHVDHCRKGRWFHHIVSKMHSPVQYVWMFHSTQIIPHRCRKPLGDRLTKNNTSVPLLGFSNSSTPDFAKQFRIMCRIKWKV
jgi:hypothetical protein